MKRLPEPASCGQSIYWH